MDTLLFAAVMILILIALVLPAYEKPSPTPAVKAFEYTLDKSFFDNYIDYIKSVNYEFPEATLHKFLEVIGGKSIEEEDLADFLADFLIDKYPHLDEYLLRNGDSWCKCNKCGTRGVYRYMRRAIDSNEHKNCLGEIVLVKKNN